MTSVKCMGGLCSLFNEIEFFADAVFRYFSTIYVNKCQLDDGVELFCPLLAVFLDRGLEFSALIGIDKEELTS